MNRLNARLLWIVVQVFLVITLMACESSDTSVPLYATKEPIILAAEPPLKGYALHDAVSRNLIEYQVTGLGGSSGDSLQIKVRRMTSTPITVYVAPGTVFATGSAGVQSMVGYSISGAIIDPGTGAMQPMNTMHLSDDAFHSFYVQAYCLDFALENPTPQDVFEVRAVDPRAATVLTAAKSEGLSIPATQAAIWMDRDHVTKQRIATKFAASEQDIEDAWQLLMRLPPPT